MTTPVAAMPPEIDVLQRRSFVVGAVALVLAVVGAFVSTDQFFQSYLFSFLFWLGIALGCLSLLMIQHLTGGLWGLAIRRFLEAGARTLPLLILMFLPVLFGAKRIYPWASGTATDELLRHAIEQKHPYLNLPFFTVRAAVYFAIWSAMAFVLSRWSLSDDTAFDERRGGRMRSVSGGGLVVMGLTVTFMSVDWVMSLDPRWFSTIYGMLFMIGQALSALALCIVLVSRFGRVRPLSAVASVDAVHDLGKLMLAFVMVWAYISFSQFLIIWSGNLPEEIPWYLRRFHGGWKFVGLALVLFHFAAPFLLLLSRRLKRNPWALASVAVAMLVIRVVDLFWLVRPEFPHTGPSLHWLDFVLPVALGGLWLGVFFRLLGGRPLLPLGEPEVKALLAEQGA